ELRKAKQAAHSAFDRLWRAKMHREGLRKKDARGAGYRWLAEQLGIDPKLCHIGWMDVATCRRVVEICRPYLRSATGLREGRDERQRKIGEWAEACFGTSRDRQERARRLFEEAAEAMQSVGVPEEMAHKIVAYVYSKPAGDPRQEAGGV